MPIHCDIKTVNAVNAIKDKYFFIPKAVQQPAAMKIAPSILPVTFRQCSFSSFFNSWLMFSFTERKFPYTNGTDQNNPKPQTALMDICY